MFQREANAKFWRSCRTGRSKVSAQFSPSCFLRGLFDTPSREEVAFASRTQEALKSPSPEASPCSKPVVLQDFFTRRFAVGGAGARPAGSASCVDWSRYRLRSHLRFGCCSASARRPT